MLISHPYYIDNNPLLKSMLYVHNQPAYLCDRLNGQSLERAGKFCVLKLKLQMSHSNKFFICYITNECVIDLKKRIN